MLRLLSRVREAKNFWQSSCPRIRIYDHLRSSKVLSAMLSAHYQSNCCRHVDILSLKWLDALLRLKIRLSLLSYLSMNPRHAIGLPPITSC